MRSLINLDHLTFKEEGGRENWFVQQFFSDWPVFSLCLKGFAGFFFSNLPHPPSKVNGPPLIVAFLFF